MHYEINVSWHGKHFFATAPRSISSEFQAREVLKLFREKFPPADGYTITLTRWETIGRTLD